MSLNFQMNRWFGLVGDVSMLDEMRTVAPRITTYADWHREFAALVQPAARRPAFDALIFIPILAKCGVSVKLPQATVRVDGNNLAHRYMLPWLAVDNRLRQLPTAPAFAHIPTAQYAF